MNGKRASTVIIDEFDRGGSYAGAWATAIAHTPHLAAQDRQQETRTAGFPPAAAARVGGAAACAREATNVAPPKAVTA